MASRSKDTYSTMRNALDVAQQERNHYRLLCESLLKENGKLKEAAESASADMEQLYEQKLQAEIASYQKQLEEAKAEVVKQTEKNSALLSQINQMSALMKDLAKAVDNNAIALQMTRIKKFVTTSEQAKILNNRYGNRDKRGEEKDNFDGTSDSVQPVEDEAKPKTRSESEAQPEPRKKSQGRRPPKEPYFCVEEVRHPLSEYVPLDDGRRFKTRDGEIEIHEKIWFEFIPAKIIKHIAETATYETPEGDCKNTLPEDYANVPVKGCPFTLEMLVFILIEKYAYHSSKNNIRRKLKEMGAGFAKSTFVRYYQLAETMLREIFGNVFKRAVLETIYLMIDETCELVGVEDPDSAVTKYLRKYLWGFYNKERGLVQYLYEKGSRATSVLVDYLTGFMGSFTSDGYVAYKYYDGDACPNITHLGCNTHCRRLFVDALPCATKICYEFIDDYERIFHNETLFKGLDPVTRQKQRERMTLPIFTEMWLRADRISKNEELMSIPLLKKAINYFLNQAENLRGFIFDGNAECCNNLMEQRFKTIKLDLKNCQVIGSEGAAENAAFMHSLVESCRLNNLNPTEYLTMLLSSVGKPLDEDEKRELLPDRWRPKS